MKISESNSTPWPCRPLCRRYMLAWVDVARVRCDGAGGLHELAVHWAFGWLPDGEGEPLGVWIAADGADAPARMLADLKRRGVERIWRVTGADAGDLAAQVAAAFSGRAVRPSVDLARSEAAVASLRHRQQAPEHAAEQVAAALARALGRRARFDGERAACGFVAGALRRLERGQDLARAAAALARSDPAAWLAVPGV